MRVLILGGTLLIGRRIALDRPGVAAGEDFSADERALAAATAS